MADPKHTHPALQALALQGADSGVIDVQAQWLASDADAYLGFECANPALQIERWGQESGAARGAFFS